jgi:hypothetical protein
MIVGNQEAVTPAVLDAYSHIDDSRMREIVAALIKHLHGFVREVRLTEQEFQQAAHIVARLGQQTTDSHNEVVLMAGSLGVSTLVWPRFKTLISQLYVAGDPYLESDVQFGVTRALIGDFVRRDNAGGESYSLDQVFTLEPGEARRPRAPVRAKRSADVIVG